VLVIGSEQLSDRGELPPLFNKGHFSEKLFDDSASAARTNVEFAEDKESAESALAAAQQRLKSGEIQVVLVFPPDFGERLYELRDQIGAAGGTARAGAQPQAANGAKIEIPEPEILFNSGKEKSRVAHFQVEHLLNAWKSQIVRENLLAGRVPANVARPFEVKPRDVAEQSQQQALMWSKILPFVLFIWALTGAFYPAVDLCAGEKERGTLETLLSSPARRTEIVWGKLLTVMTFSGATAMLNLASLGFTARYIISQLQMMPGAGPELSEGLDLPPLLSALWLVVALVPMTALFSALCLACAAFARSTKEGQYYLMPLLLVTMPLMMLPMAPGAELNLGNSLIPVTGVVLLLKGLIQGNYGEVIHYVVPVCVVTLVCCHLAIRWAVYQFNQESVLFRESERLDLRRWVVHLVRDRQDTPSLGEAFFCVAVIYIIQFFARFALSAAAPASPDFNFLAVLLLVSQVVCIALPALLMAVLLTRRPMKTLLLERMPKPAICAAAVLLAVLLHPLGLQVVHWITQLYPVQEEVLSDTAAFGKLFQSAPYPWLPYLLMAVLPALCEELAFRGFILSGLRHLGSKWWAIGLSALFFGMAHTVIQQSMAAAGLGLVIGYIAVQTGSLVPCILFHMTYNAVMFSMAELAALYQSRPALSGLLVQGSPDVVLYIWPVTLICTLAAAVLLWWLHRLPYQATREEAISEARALQGQHPLASGMPGNVE
jgi:sodium transport system permease protein